MTHRVLPGQNSDYANQNASVVASTQPSPTAALFEALGVFTPKPSDEEDSSSSPIPLAPWNAHSFNPDFDDLSSGSRHTIPYSNASVGNDSKESVLSGSDKENSDPSCGNPPIPSSADDFKLNSADPALHSSDSTIPDPDLPTANVDYLYQEPSFEHAVDPVMPSPLPNANLRQPPVWSPIVDRRLSKALGQEAYLSVHALQKKLSQDSLRAKRPKKRSANECRTPRETSAEKRARKGLCTALIDHIDEQLAANQHRHSPHAPSYSPISNNQDAVRPPSDGPAINNQDRTAAPSESPSIVRPAAPDSSVFHSKASPRPAGSPLTPDRDLARPAAPRYDSLFVPVAEEYKAYPGQFVAVTDEFLGRQGLQPQKFTFPEGVCNLNANGSYTNSRMIEARPAYRLDYSARFRSGRFRKTTKREEDMYAILEAKTWHAFNVKIDDSKISLMRARIHHEASQARIVGCSAGEFRYYDGHLTIEDYIINGVCVCWERCACSAVCTRYPDMLCPCSEHTTMDEN
jgi:hypothetical protein